MVSDEIKTSLTSSIRWRSGSPASIGQRGGDPQRDRSARANLSDPGRPIGAFLFVGPSGVGKMELALTLAEFLYGGDQNMTDINMSEFKEEHSSHCLWALRRATSATRRAACLPKAVRRRPYSVVLLDEMEKAHPGVQDILYQVFDKGA